MKKFLPFLLLALAVFGVYAPALRNGFVWDDTALILRDPLIRSWRLIPEGFQHFLFTDATASDFYRPMQRLTYTFEYAAAGFVPALYHFTSILCHLLATIALFLFARELMRMFEVGERRRGGVALLAAIVWAMHPLHTSAVAYISGRADSLAAIFGFAALHVALRLQRASGRALWGLAAAAGTLLLLSLLTKESGAVFLPVFLALLLLRKNRTVVLPAAAAIGFALVSYAVLRTSAEHNPAPAGRQITGLVRPIIMARAVAEYAGLTVLPLHLQMDRTVETQLEATGDETMTLASWRELQTLLGLVLLAAFIYCLVRSRQRAPAIFTCLLLALISYVPVSGLIPLNATVAEHWLYIPTAFLFLAGSIAVAQLQAARLPITALISAWLVFLSARTFARTFDWKDQRTFLERTITSGGDSPRMLTNLGGLELSEGNLELARKHLERALQKEPELPFAVINLAAVAVRGNDFARAHELLERAKEMPLVAAQAHELLAVLESKETGNANHMRLRLATRTGPPNWQIEKRYIQLLAELGATDAAIRELRVCLNTQWYRADSWKLLSDLLTKAGRASEAAAAALEARRYDVHLPQRG